MQLIADGHSYKVVAQKLWLSRHTIVSHVRRIKGRYQAKTMPHLIYILIKAGEIE